MRIDNIEKFIISGLLKNKDYSNVVISFARSEFFENPSAKKLIGLILEYSFKYNKIPVKESLSIELDRDKSFTDDGYKQAIEFLKDVYDIDHSDDNLKYALDSTEQYFRTRAAINVITDGIHILDGKDKKRNLEALPDMFREALSISFDTRVGHDYFEDSVERWSSEEEERVPFKHNILNTITNGGMPIKTLVVPIATPGGGKSMFMSDWCAFLVQKGYDCVYFTMELSEKMVGKRVDANILDTPINKLSEIPVEYITDQVNLAKKKSKGKLYIKEFPAGAASAADFRRILKELELKKGIKPKLVCIDYIGICASSRYKAGDTNSYGIGKAVAEELRGIGQEFECVVCAPSQFNRSGFGGKDAKVGGGGMEAIADSVAVAFTADLAFSLFSNDELKETGRVIVSQLKNRYGDADRFKRFPLGQDSSRMKFFDVDDEDLNETKKKYGNIDDELAQAAHGSSMLAMGGNSMNGKGGGFTFD
jgi:replicative DNA helicase